MTIFYACMNYKRSANPPQHVIGKYLIPSTWQFDRGGGAMGYNVRPQAE